LFEQNKTPGVTAIRGVFYCADLAAEWHAVCKLRTTKLIRLKWQLKNGGHMKKASKHSCPLSSNNPSPSQIRELASNIRRRWKDSEKNSPIYFGVCTATELAADAIGSKRSKAYKQRRKKPLRSVDTLKRQFSAAVLYITVRFGRRMKKAPQQSSRRGAS